jgi:exopolysaccharide biosynthesis predicted pyruvyltransferase EpsI
LERVQKAHTSPVREFLSEFRNRRVVYVHNPGNAGDSVIACAMMEALTQQNITWDLATLDGDVTGRIVLIPGGGNLVPMYDHVATAIRNFVRKAKLLVVLPHTIAGHPEVLSLLDESCVVFCRDATNYRYVLEQTDRCKVYIGHDLTFFLNGPEWLNANYTTQRQDFFLSRMEKDVYDWRGALANARFFRTDAEHMGRFKPGDIDISALFESGAWPETAPTDAWAFLEAIRLAENIETDRLHVAIGAAILGKPCNLYDNSYGKNRAVYRHSIRHYFPSIKFIEEKPAGVV